MQGAATDQTYLQTPVKGLTFRGSETQSRKKTKIGNEREHGKGMGSNKKGKFV